MDDALLIFSRGTDLPDHVHKLSRDTIEFRHEMKTSMALSFLDIMLHSVKSRLKHQNQTKRN